MMRTWSGPEAAKLVGCTYTRLDSWARVKFIEPTTPASGTGTRRQYTFQDLLVLRLAVVLREDGVRVPMGPMQQLLTHVGSRQGLGAPEANANGIFLVTDGMEVWETTEADTFRAPTSEILLYVVNLQTIVDEMSAKVRPAVLRMPRRGNKPANPGGIKAATKNPGPLLKKKGLSRVKT